MALIYIIDFHAKMISNWENIKTLLFGKSTFKRLLLSVTVKMHANFKNVKENKNDLKNNIHIFI